MASQKVHLLRYAQAELLRRTSYVRLIPQLSQALHLELFALPSCCIEFANSSNLECIFITLYKKKIKPENKAYMTIYFFANGKYRTNKKASAYALTSSPFTSVFLDFRLCLRRIIVLSINFNELLK